MIDGHTIDFNGYILEPVVNLPESTKDGDKRTDGNIIIVTRCPDGFYKPQWNGTEWVDANAPTAAQQLASAQQARLVYLQQSFNKAIAQGFTSTATGTGDTYAIDPIAMGKWTGTLALINSGGLTGNVIVKDINGNKVALTIDQFKTFALDGFNYYNSQEQNLWAKEINVENALDIPTVNAVSW